MAPGFSKIVSHKNEKIVRSGAGSNTVNINDFHKATDNESCFIYNGHGVSRFANFFDDLRIVIQLSYNGLK